MTTPAPPRGLVFGTAAESYERFRLGYPDEVVERTLSYVGAPVDDAVEIGAGTGKATRAFTSRGVSVTALEPDPGMLAVLERETAGMPVRALPLTFEAYDGPPARLLYAAAAWHWTDPATRWSHAADQLVPGGVVAIFGGPLRLADPCVQTVVADAASAVLDQADDPAFLPPVEGDPFAHTPFDRELRASERFTDVRFDVIQRVVQLPQREYIGYLSTLSACLVLTYERRQALLARISDAIPDMVAVDLSVGLHLARTA